MFYDKKDASAKDLVLMALTEMCTSDVCCLEAFLLCLPVHIDLYKNADPLQHAAVHMRRALRGTAMIHLKTSTGPAIEEYCSKYLAGNKATAFGILTVLYYEIRRCVSSDKRLLIQRCEADEGYPEGSAVLVSQNGKHDTATNELAHEFAHVDLAAIEDLALDTATYELAHEFAHVD